MACGTINRRSRRSGLGDNQHGAAFNIGAFFETRATNSSNLESKTFRMGDSFDLASSERGEQRKKMISTMCNETIDKNCQATQPPDQTNIEEEIRGQEDTSKSAHALHQ